MDTDPQFLPHEADTGGRFTTENAKEMGAKGAAKRLPPWGGTRLCLPPSAPRALRSVDLPAIGDPRSLGCPPVGTPTVSTSLVEQWAAEP